MSHFSAVTSEYLQSDFCIWSAHKMLHDTLLLWGSALIEHLFFFSYRFTVCSLCSMCTVCVWFTAVYIANSGWALFNEPYLWDSGFSKAYKLWMKAEAKLIKCNRIKMWLVTQHGIKIAPLNDRKQSVFTSSWP